MNFFSHLLSTCFLNTRKIVNIVNIVVMAKMVNIVITTLLVKVEEHQNIARLINQSLISRRVSPRHPPQAFLLGYKLVWSFVSGLILNMWARELVNLQCTMRQRGHFED